MIHLKGEINREQRVIRMKKWRQRQRQRQRNGGRWGVRVGGREGERQERDRVVKVTFVIGIVSIIDAAIASKRMCS